MIKRFFRYLLPMLLSSAANASQLPSDCQSIDHMGGRYTVCSFDPAKAKIRLYQWDAIAGKPYGSFEALSSALWRQHSFVTFAMNAGMYHRDLSPVGLHIENGVEKTPISTSGGWGNFHMQPNGVFFIEGDRAGVLETSAYLNANLKPDVATQSGPMLVIEGQLHPRFLPQSDSLNTRNGVGVSADGIVHFAISENPVRFYDFATLFRDRLATANALYLDGSISSVHIPGANRRDSWHPMGPIIAVVENVPD